jgi:hypothetical protein
MPRNLLFWGLYLICILFGFWLVGPADQPWYRRTGLHIVLWILIGMLGWQIFGPAVR